MKKQPIISDHVVLKNSTGQEEKFKDEEKFSFLYRMLMAFFTGLIPVFVILFFDSYNKEYLSYYKIYDVKLSYSLEMVLKEILPSGIVLLLLIICTYFASCAVSESGLKNKIIVSSK